MKKSEFTRQQILDAAYEVFAQKGWEATNLQDIADRLQITRGPIYYYFKNRLELYSAVVESAVDTHTTLCKQHIDSDTPFFEMVEQLLSTWLEQRQVHSFVNDLVSKPELLELRKIYTASCNKTYEQLTARIQREQEGGFLRSDFEPQELTEWIYIFFNGLLCMVNSPVTSHCKANPQKTIRLYVEQLRQFASSKET